MYFTCSMRWLKGRLKSLGLFRRAHGHWASDSTVKNCIMVYNKRSLYIIIVVIIVCVRENCEHQILSGYRRMWTILRDKYQLKSEKVGPL